MSTHIANLKQKTFRNRETELRINDSLGSLHKSKLFDETFIMKGSKIYLLRKIFLIFSEPTESQVNTSMFLYYPIKKKFIPYNQILRVNESSYTICSTIKDICKEIFRFCMLKIIDGQYKINLYNEKFSLVANDMQLYQNMKHNCLLYAKITKLASHSIATMIKSCANHLDPKPLFFTTCDNFGLRRQIPLFKSTERKEMGTTFKGTNEDYKATKTPYNHSKFLSQSSSRNGNDSSFNNLDYDVSNLKLGMSSYNTMRKEKSKKRKKFRISKDPYVKKIMIKNLSLSSEFHEGGNNEKHKEKNDFYISTEDEEKHIKKVRNIFIELKKVFNSYVKEKVSFFLTDGEIMFFKYLKYNFILINEMESFPVLSLKKEFVFFAFLSHYVNSCFPDIVSKFYTALEDSSDLSFFFRIKEIDDFLIDVYEMFKKTSTNKLFFLNNIKFEDENLSISYFFFILFCATNSNVCMNSNKDIFFILLKSLQIDFKSNVTFQQFAYYKLLMKNEENLNINKKFVFLKTFFKNVLAEKNKYITFIKKNFGLDNETIKYILENDVLSIQSADYSWLENIENCYQKVVDYYK